MQQLLETGICLLPTARLLIHWQVSLRLVRVRLIVGLIIMILPISFHFIVG
jgi:hypothetical protein